jgi:YesN/AraC family two-component response regulator
VLLAFFGYPATKFAEAEEGETALRLLWHGDFEVVISDFNLPGELTGIDILDPAQAMRRKITGLLITPTVPTR